MRLTKNLKYLPALPVLLLALLLFTSVSRQAWAICAPVTVAVSNTNGDQSAGSLGDAINQVDANPCGGVIDMSAVASGTINLTASLPAVTQSLTILGSNVTVNGLAGQAFDVQSGAVSVADLILAGAQAVSFGGGGVNAVLSAANSYSGGTSVAGTALLSVGADNNLGAAATTLTLNNGTLQTSAGISFDSARGMLLTSGNGTFDTNGQDSSWNGIISGAGGLTITGAGALTLSNQGNSFFGDTTVTGGALLSLDADQELGNGATLVLDNGTLQNNGQDINFTISSIREALLGSGGGTIDTVANSLTAWFAQVTGLGTLNVSGPGTLFLASGTGFNTYTGGTYVGNGSVLAIQTGADLGTGSVTLDGGTLSNWGNLPILTQGIVLTANGGTIDVNANYMTLTGVISGSGGLVVTQNGGVSINTFCHDCYGFVNFGSGNTYTGGTLVTGYALLNVFDESSLGDTTVLAPVTLRDGYLQTFLNDFHSDRTMVLEGSFGGMEPEGHFDSWDGLIIGTAMLEVGDEGALTITNGGNTYSGGTSIWGGSTVVVDQDGNLGDPTGRVVLRGGALQVSTGVSFDPSRPLELQDAGGFFDVNGFDSSWNGVVTGPADLWVVSGLELDEDAADFETPKGGSLTLTSVNNYTGWTYVAGATLVQAVAGALPADARIYLLEQGVLDLAGIPLTITAAGILEGEGIVDGAVTNNGWIIANVPGEELGIEDLDLGPTGNVEIDVLPVNKMSGELEVDDVNLDGPLSIQAITYSAGQTVFYGVRYKYTVLEADTPINGTFSSLTDNLSYMDSELIYGSQAITLVLIRNDTDFTANASTRNQLTVAGVLNQVALVTGSQSLTVATDAFYDKLNELYFLSPGGQKTAMDQMGGSSYVPLASLALNHSQFTADTLFQRFGTETFHARPQAAAPGTRVDKEDQAYWVEGMGNFGTWTGDANVTGYNINDFGLLTGYDAFLDPDTKAGVFLDYNNMDLTSTQVGAHTTFIGVLGGAYGSRSFGILDVAALVDFGLDRYTTTRTVAFGSDVSQPKSAFDGNRLAGSLRISIPVVRQENWSLKPLAGMHYTHLTMDGFTEKNADSLNLTVASQTYDSFRPMGGLSFAGNWSLGDGLELAPSVDLTASREVGTVDPKVQASFAGAQGKTFTMTGPAATDPAIFGVEAGLKVGVDPRLGFYAHYTGDFGAGQTSHAFNGGMNLWF